MQPLISVIIPVYQVERYLTACVESVLAQTFSDFEIILVDDGSPDNCPAICDSFAMRDSRVRVIHKENGGLSSARNAGLDAARGEYLAFLDGDDLWSPLFLERLYRAVRETDADFAVCQFRRFRDVPDMTPGTAETQTLTREEAFACLFDSRNETMVVAWNKLYRAELFHDIRYPVGLLHEDEAVIHEVIGGADKIAWVDEVHSYYRRRPDSITARFSLKRLDEMLAKEKRIAYFESCGMQALADRTKIVYLNNLMRLYRTVQAELDDRDTCRMLHQRFCGLYSTELVRSRSPKTKLRFALFRRFPGLFSRMEYLRMKREDIP